MKFSENRAAEISLIKIQSVFKYLLIIVLTSYSIGSLKSQQKDPDYISLTNISYTKGDINEAYRLLNILEKKYPDNGHVLAERGGWQMYGDNDVNAALVTLSKAVKLLPNDDNILTLRGIAFYKKGWWKKQLKIKKPRCLSILNLFNFTSNSEAIIMPWEITMLHYLYF